MWQQRWILMLVMSVVVVSAARQAGADPRAKQQSLQKLAHDMIQTARVDAQQQQDYEQESSGSWDWRIRNTASGASFYVPQTLQHSDGLWYNLGWYQLDNLTVDFGQPLGEESPGTEAAPIAPAPATTDLNNPGTSAAPPPSGTAPAPPAAQSSAALPPSDDGPAAPDVFDYPFKAQFFVELVREYGSRQVKRQGARPLKLEDVTLRQIEQIVQDEIKAIETAQQKVKKQSTSADSGSAELDDVSQLLMDYDARITRLVMAQLDAQADKRGLLLRKNREAGAAGGAEPVQVRLKFPVGVAEPNRVLVMCGGNFDYLKNTWDTPPEAKLDDKRWKQVPWEKVGNQLVATIPPGRQAIVAVWDNDGKIQFARAHKYPDVLKGDEEVVFDAVQPAAHH